MSVNEELQELRRHLEELAAASDKELSGYELRWPPIPPGTYWRLRWLIGWILRFLEATKLKKPDRWPASLKHSSLARAARPLLVWAVGVDRDVLRESRQLLADLPHALPDLAPVLITDVADFATFSRLGYLVEYLPELAGRGPGYEMRKARLVARLYRNAPTLTINAMVKCAGQPEQIRRLIDDQGPRGIG